MQGGGPELPAGVLKVMERQGKEGQTAGCRGVGKETRTEEEARKRRRGWRQGLRLSSMGKPAGVCGSVCLNAQWLKPKLPTPPVRLWFCLRPPPSPGLPDPHNHRTPLPPEPRGSSKEHKSLGVRQTKSKSFTLWLDDLGQVTSPLWASVSCSVK